MPPHHRITRCLLALITALVLTWSGPVWAQSKEMEVAFEQYEKLKAQGKYAESIPYAKRFIKLAGQEFGETHQYYAAGLSNLALLYHLQGRYAAAEPLYTRSLAIDEKTLGPEHPNVARSLNNLAELYYYLGRYAATERLHKRALAVRENSLGPEHPDVANSLNNLALLYGNRGRYGAAEPLHKRSLAIKVKALGPEHPDVALSLNNLAELYRAQGRHAKAEPLYKRSQEILEKALGPEHPDVATSLNNLASLYLAQARYAKALAFKRRGMAVLHKRFATQDVQENEGLLSEQRDRKWEFIIHIDLAMHPEQAGSRSKLVGEAFEVLQLARTSAAGGAIARMAARVVSTVDSYNHLLAKIFASQPAARDPGALHRRSCGLESLSGVRIRGPGPWAVVRDP